MNFWIQTESLGPDVGLSPRLRSGSWDGVLALDGWLRPHPGPRSLCQGPDVHSGAQTLNPELSPVSGAQTSNHGPDLHCMAYKSSPQARLPPGAQMSIPVARPSCQGPEVQFGAWPWREICVLFSPNFLDLTVLGLRVFPVQTPS